MPSVTFTIADTDGGGLVVAVDLPARLAGPASPAQRLAIEFTSLAFYSGAAVSELIAPAAPHIPPERTAS